jgi:hypothetical protein
MKAERKRAVALKGPLVAIVAAVVAATADYFH